MRLYRHLLTSNTFATITLSILSLQQWALNLIVTSLTDTIKFNNGVVDTSINHQLPLRHAAYSFTGEFMGYYPIHNYHSFSMHVVTRQDIFDQFNSISWTVYIFEGCVFTNSTTNFTTVIIPYDPLDEQRNVIKLPRTFKSSASNIDCGVLEPISQLPWWDLHGQSLCSY